MHPPHSQGWKQNRLPSAISRVLASVLRDVIGIVLISAAVVLPAIALAYLNQ